MSSKELKNKKRSFLKQLLNNVSRHWRDSLLGGSGGTIKKAFKNLPSNLKGLSKY